MAIRFLTTEVSDLCLGKPALKSLPISSTVADALSALKRSGEIHVSIWTCDHSYRSNYSGSGEDCRCVGKICMIDVICFLCRDENLCRPLDALQSPVSELLSKVIGGPGLVRHLEPHSSLLNAIDYILDGTQNLVIPIHSYKSPNSRKKLLNKPASFESTSHNGVQYCWLTQEDIVRFLLNGIGFFSPIPTLTIESMNIIDTNVMTVHHNAPAFSVLNFLYKSHMEQTSIAVTDESNRLIGEISPFTLACCDETAAAAIATLSACDLMAYIDFGGPPQDLVQIVKTRLSEKKLTGMLDLLEETHHPFSSCSSSSGSSDDEFASGRQGGAGKYSPARRSETIVCSPRSSLMAVMIQALAYRVSTVWVVEDDFHLIGIVTFTGMLKIFRSVAGVRSKIEGE